MEIYTLFLLLVLVSVSVSFPDLPGEEYEEDDEEKRPYNFAYTASRYYNGLPDREHLEERGIDGVTRGVYRYIDPRYQVQEVIYVSDDDGFHVDASNLPQDTPAVHAAKLRHEQLFNQIKKQHAQLAKELEEQRKIDEEEQLRQALEEADD